MTGEIDDVLSQADVVIAFGHRLAELKFAGESLLQEVDSLLIQVGDAEGLMMGEALVSQGADDAFQTSRTRLGQARVLESLGDGR